LDQYNDLLFQRKEASRKELFQSVERGYLKPLPTSAYEVKDYKRAKVQKIGYVYFSVDKCYYSVPYRYIGHSTLIHYTRSTIEVYYNNERIAVHERNLSKGNYITNKNHLSSTHKAFTQWSPDYFKTMAARHGHNVLACIETVLSEHDYPEAAYKRCMGIVQYHRAYGSQRLDNACKMALLAETCSYTRIGNILKRGLDKEYAGCEMAFNNRNEPHIPLHQNQRGRENYQ
jgi:hypothetical protein